MSKRIRTARELVIWALHRNEDNATILARVKKAHPKSPMTLATINFIRNSVRKTDNTVASERALKRSR